MTRPAILRLLAAGRAALQWRLLLLWLAGLLLPAVLVSLPVWLLLARELDFSTHAPALAQALDMVAITDLGTAFERDRDALAAAGTGALLVTLLLSPLLTGAVVTAARAAKPPCLRELLAGAGEQYPRMFRMLAWAAVPLGAAAALGGELADAAQQHADRAITYADTQPWQLAAAGAAVLLVLVANLTLDAGRAMLAADRRRSGAIRAWRDGLVLLWRRPGGALLAWAVPTVAGLLLAAVLGWCRMHVPAIGLTGTVGALLLAQAIVLALAWMRMARLFALVALAQDQAGPPHLH
ncbi:hypothetical protein [Pseudoduganella albidiflava]|uniref:Uncharacterized protein n=1 Tax=Pseudoduganella albidiflava TaxID=321983 RepID=A0A411X264_9BURK|nr:hypothetical protein [Pseudoduganella albidiflava]QBI03067.1 hypothetical protein EYF70_21195 [Pseudoduganella albidiflava]GGY58768.1 hypothetical protein GCM10007387_46650 [Pseudoduganella albidiflava]